MAINPKTPVSLEKINENFMKAFVDPETAQPRDKDYHFSNDASLSSQVEDAISSTQVIRPVTTSNYPQNDTCHHPVDPYHSSSSTGYDGYKPPNQKVKKNSSITYSANGYTQIIEVFNEHGIFMNHSIESVIRVLPDALFGKEPFYRIVLQPGNLTLDIPDKDYDNNQSLLKHFRKALGPGICQIKSAKYTAECLRAALDSRIQEVTLPYYVGWLMNSDGDFCYRLTTTGSTHYRKDMLLEQIIPPEYNTTSPEKYHTESPLKPFTVVASSVLRSQLITIFMLASTYQLWEALGYRFPFAFYLDCTDQASANLVSNLMTMYGDPVLKTTLPSKDFRRKIVDYCDQAIPILHQGASPNSIENHRFLQDILNSASISLSDKNPTQHSLKALPVFIGTQVSSLAIHHQVITLEISSDDFSSEAKDLLADPGDVCNPLRGSFNGVWNADTLRSWLKKGRALANDRWFGSMDNEDLTAMAVLYALWEFMHNAFLDDLIEIDDHWSCLANDIIHRTNIPDDTGAVFRSSVFRCISKREIPLEKLGQIPSDTANKPIVFYDDKFYCFNCKAMTQIAQSMGLRRPSLITVLAKEGLLCGSRVNNTTCETRRTGTNAYGQSVSIPCFCIEKSALSPFGARLLEEVVDND